MNSGEFVSTINMHSVKGTRIDSPLRVDSPQIRMMMMMFLSGMCMSLCPKKTLISSFVVRLLGSLMGGSDQMMIRINMLMGLKMMKDQD